MNPSAFACALALLAPGLANAATAADRDFWYVGKDVEGPTFAFFDAATLRDGPDKHRTGVVTWVFAGDAVTAKDGKTQRRTYDFDCADRQISLRARIAYAADGHVVDSSVPSAAAPFEPVAPYAISSGMLDFACSAPSTRGTGAYVSMHLGDVDPQQEGDRLYLVFRHHQTHPRPRRPGPKPPTPQPSQ